ncbi:MAG: DUF935 family protein [Myxococcales bacterium]|nr:DUF935 family protein [Myxococcales bacterium]
MANAFSSLVDFVRSYVGPRTITQSDNPLARWRRNLTPQSRVQTRLFFADIEDAVQEADNGNLGPAARLCSALRSDGNITGQLSTRYDGLLQLPRFIEGSEEKLTAGLREDFDRVFPSSELSLIAADGGLLGVMFGEFIQEGSRLVLRHRNPEFLQYRRSEDRWFIQTQFDGLVPITPGDGHWVLHLPGGVEHPWRAKTMWRALSRAFISKEHAIFFRDAWNQSMAHPAKVAKTKQAATDDQRHEFLAQINEWAQNAGFVLPPEWELTLLQANIQGYQTFAQSIDAADKEIVLTINGQTPTTEGGPGFQNTAVHAKIRSDLIQSDANGMSAMLNEQCIPVWANERCGWGSVPSSPRVRWDTTPPKDRKAEADAANTAAQAIKGWNEALAATGTGKVVDAVLLAQTYGIPLRDGVFSPPANN